MLNRLAIQMRANPDAAGTINIGGGVPIVLDDDCEVSFYKC